MMRNGTRARSGPRTTRTRSTREPLGQGPAPGPRQSKRSRQAEGLQNHDGGVGSGDQHARYTRHGIKEPPKMQSPPEGEAKSSRRDGCQGQQPPVGQSDAEDDNREEDLYRGEDEIEKERQEKRVAYSAPSGPNSEDQNSVADPEFILTYSRREWKGDTTKSHLIRKGYEAVAQRFEKVQRVRGDNYCALRATLFQILSQSQKLPDQLQDPEMWPKQVLSEEDLVAKWRFPFKDELGTVEQRKCCLKLLLTRWKEAVQCKSPAERQRFCQKVFAGKDEEYKLLEALKFLMLRTAIQLHSAMEKESRVPDFCYLLFARDSSKCPETFFTNHLRHVGFSGGLEQVEMFLLGYTLQQTIQVYRLYKFGTEEFITFYPDDHKKDWPCLSLVTEDDRHYNVLVCEKSKQQTSTRPTWKAPSAGKGKEGLAARQ